MNTNNFDVQLPPFTIEPATDRVRSMGRPMSWGVQYLRTPEVWAESQGEGVIAFVVDTEDYTDHPDVFPQLLPEYCRRFTNETEPSRGGHGLHVADTILQVAPQTKIALLKGLTNEGSGFSTWIGNAIRHAADVDLLPEHAGFKRVVNLSLGSNVESPVIRTAIDYARDRGVEVFAAAGNDGKDVDYPGALDDLVITVGAIDSNSRPATFSSPGPAVDLACPGVKIDGAWGSDGYVSISGTSMATPHAVGVACLFLSKRSTNDLELHLCLKATDIYTDGKDEKTGYGVPYATNYFERDEEPTPEPEPVPQPVQGTPIWVWIGAGGVTIGMILWFIFGQ